VRIAFSGSHRVGKSTLLASVAERCPGYECLDEPYHLLEEDEHEFAHPPTVDDYTAQLRRSIAEIRRSGPDVLFDRCPADFLAYLLALGVDVSRVLDRAAASMARLDLVVLVPIEEPDRVTLNRDEDPQLRRAVDDELGELLLDDDFGEDLDVLVVHGDLSARTAQVVARIGS
jgi:predicted ATPase